MAKKTEEVEKVVEIVEAAPLPVSTDLGREDLNELARAVNFLLSRLK